MQIDRSAMEFAQKIRDTDDLDHAWALLMEHLEPHGVIHAKYGFIAAQSEASHQGDILMVGRFCEEWEQVQADRAWFANDRIVLHCLTEESPLTFARLYDLMDRGLLTPEETRNHRVGREIGLAHGVAIPLRDGNPLSLGGISLEASRSFGTQEFDDHLRDRLGQITSLVETFHANIDRPQLLSPERHPSPRERDCLLWIMRGLRTKQIAERMGTHPKTVEKQLGNVRRKLNARTNAQAATRALILDLITP